MMRSYFKRPVACAFALIMAFTFGITIFSQVPVRADTPGWDPGRIIDDSIFTNNTSMNVAQIQQFLNSKVSSCDTNGTRTSEYGGGTRAQYAATRGVSGPFTCLKDYTENGLSSAQIISNVANAYQINPQVLIVLLQKEQGLVTDDWPWPIQYRSATGYGCPDTAPCDAQYYGLTNQVTWAAKMFRAIENASPTWYTPYNVGNNYIQYSPTASCGGTTVNIQNRATQALYNYTPYQPNPAAVASTLGQTVSCGAYGNLNFYRYFTSWFGDTRGYVGIAGTNNTFNVSTDTNTYSSVVTATAERSAITSATCYQQGSNYLINGVQGNTWIKITQPSSGWVATDSALYQSVVVANNVPACSYAVTPVYRAYSPRAEQHFWTTDTNEVSFVLNTLKFREGSPSYFAALNSPTYSGLPVWRLYNRAKETHFWTTDPAERQFVKQTLGFQDEGYAFSVPYGDAGTKPVWRLYNPRKETHFWTADPAERDFTVNNLGFRLEGQAFRVPQ